MKRSISIQLKAAFLLVVFSLNTIVGFACAVGVDMGFNTHHQHTDKEVFEHSHSHHHDDSEQEAPENLNIEADEHHHYNEAEEVQTGTGNISEKKDCCNDDVLKISQADKAIPQVNVLINPVSFAAFFSSFYSRDTVFLSQATPNKKYFVRGHHPPISNIRIAIQSFQI